MKYSFKAEDLTSEKNLWDVYKLSRKIRPGKFQVLCVALTFVALWTNAFFLVKNDNSLLIDVRKWAEFGFDFSITTLGFLIAGFTIFATLSKPRMMLAMMDHINKETKLPTLKYNFFTFMKVFIAYIAISIAYLLVMILGQADGFFSNLVSLFPGHHFVKIALIKVAYIAIGSSFVYLLLLLKSFVFNIYAIVMNFLRWEYHEND
jgi:uncharacterized integral membrane protein